MTDVAYQIIARGPRLIAEAGSRNASVAELLEDEAALRAGLVDLAESDIVSELDTINRIVQLIDACEARNHGAGARPN